MLVSAAAWFVVLPLAAWALLRAGGWDAGWPAPQLLAFTPLAALGAAVAVALMLLVRRRPQAVVAALSAIVLVVVIAPRGLGGEAHAGDRAPLRVLTLNLHGEGANPAAVVALIRRSKADVVSLQELSPANVRRLDRAGIRAVLPHRVLEPRPKQEGTGLYARLPLRRESRPLAFRYALSAARVRVPGGRTVRILAVHTQAPAGRSFIPGWRRDLALLPEAGGGGPPRILAGDFNATLDHRPLRDLIDTGYRDAADATGRGLTPTWPEHRRFPPVVTIDHVLADDSLTFGEVKITEVDGTDHRAVFAEVLVPRRR